MFLIILTQHMRKQNKYNCYFSQSSTHDNRLFKRVHHYTLQLSVTVWIFLAWTWITQVHICSCLLCMHFGWGLLLLTIGSNLFHSSFLIYYHFLFLWIHNFSFCWCRCLSFPFFCFLCSSRLHQLRLFQKLLSCTFIAGTFPTTYVLTFSSSAMQSNILRGMK